MAYKFSEKKKHTREENTYILYMILGSYFRKAVCRSWCLTQTLHLYYLDMKVQKQEKVEAEVIRQAERLLADVKDTLAGMNCEVQIRLVDGCYRMAFRTGFEEIRVCVEPGGSYEIELVGA